MKCGMRYFLADIFSCLNLSKGVHLSGQVRLNARGVKKTMNIYSWKYSERNNEQCEKVHKISLFQAFKNNSPPKPEGLCCMKVCYIRHAFLISLLKTLTIYVIKNMSSLFQFQFVRQFISSIDNYIINTFQIIFIRNNIAFLHFVTIKLKF